MKIRKGFVSNSSSTSFMITNTSKEKKTLVDFVKENPQLIVQYRDEYHDEDEYNQVSLIKSARQDDIVFQPGEKKKCIFGDEEGTLIGKVFDYILRDGGSSENFKWKFDEMFR